MARVITVYVGHELRDRMATYDTVINWSSVAQQAFIAAMRDVDRLREEKLREQSKVVSQWAGSAMLELG